MSPSIVVLQKLLCICSCLLPTAYAKTRGKFLDVRPVDERGPADLLAELESANRTEDFDYTNMTDARTERLEVALTPLFRIVSQSKNGRVDANSARYMLHRLFANRHGWFMNGLAQHESSTSASKAGRALYDSGNSFSLRQIARFAATLETLVHAENIERLQKVFQLFGYAREKRYDHSTAQEVVEAYMVYFLTIAMQTNPSYEERVEYCSMVPEWEETKSFAEEVRRSVYQEELLTESMSLWDSCLRAVEEIGERYGRWQNKHCVEMKSKLMQMEITGTGRVPLSSFWKPYLDDPRWPFVESTSTLGYFGALDSGEDSQDVVIPNYLYSSLNCLAGSKYYDVCCISECDSLLSEIETRIGASTTSPRRLAEVLAALPSSTVDAPRVLPATLLQRLEGVAAQNQGAVMLHGRLFAQVLHHAYPRECPYPHLSANKTEETERRKMRIDSAARVTIESVTEYAEEVARNSEKVNMEHTDDLPWNDEEELFVQSLALDAGNDVVNSETSMLVLLLAGALTTCALVFRVLEPLQRFAGVSGKGCSAYVV
eukprot:TRINITY_DN5479_c0_g1_i1.p1 TRINITY_DN5479_c0_g1~~TRINITY_DN5479_c0_g1_i1.p1  ORF type:complete len:545 (+),score=66.98 TRINITY_DN5479_c0_g1_i1:159-1793(+)